MMKAQADDALQISPDEDTNESNDENEQQTNRYKGKQFLAKVKVFEKKFIHIVNGVDMHITHNMV